MKRIPAIFRTFGFWTGILVFWSIWWLWQDSMRHEQFATLSPTPGIILSVNSSFGKAAIGFRQTPGGKGGWRFFHSTRKIDSSGESWFPPSLDLRHSDIYSPAYDKLTVLTLPYWIIMLAGMMLWFVLLASRLAIRRLRQHGNPFALAAKTEHDRDGAPLESSRMDRQRLSR